MVEQRLLDEEKVFKDPVHRYVHVREKVIWELIDSPEFQRLRRIRQLGTSYFTFHGGEHSRFNHSLGVYEIMRRILETFEGRVKLPYEEKLLCLCAALLHDVGHGPFSHSFEKVFRLDHEEWTRKIIMGETGINRILRTVSESFPKKVAEVIAKTYENKLIVSLISSQIDADRMDYLLRDAYYTGVNYGNFDIERILRVMRPSEDGAVIKASGMHAVEDYIMSRYQMYWQVYFHPVTRSAEVVLHKIFKRAKELFHHDYGFQLEPTHFLPFFCDRIQLEDYLMLDESIVYFYMHQWRNERDSILSDLCSRFLDRNLLQYVEYNPRNFRTEYEIRELFQEAGIDPDYYVEVDSTSDLPYDYYRPGKEQERISIMLVKPNGEQAELSTMSEIVEAVCGKRRFDYKLYYPADLIETLPAEHAQKIKERLGVVMSDA
ncbi:Deoxyguanosinetriphosphate triphosphohydrolase [Brevibacillus laterosporus]|uniref:HD domain-containing protein n=1 Tax=Brevibacillus laterosporus TaxID=1465 RepID=A0A518V3Y4_BRELA|nr:HD domain-containing protein [Brevibacillus laterosporus]QDX91690.1 HD domain-containing protein [Brevibacillus laterosporus]RAP29718.1 Deoxyguanosinetriphosphate triphosphohydrolase [Brevibacillus laterosporus]